MIINYRNLLCRKAGGEGEVFQDQGVGDGHGFAVDFGSRVVEPDGIAPGFGHFAAVGAGEEKVGNYKGFFVAQIFLQHPACLHVEGLVSASDLDICIHVIGIVTLHDRIEELVKSDLFTFGKAFFD